MKARGATGIKPFPKEAAPQPSRCPLAAERVRRPLKTPQRGRTAAQNLKETAAHTMPLASVEAQPRGTPDSATRAERRMRAIPQKEKGLTVEAKPPSPEKPGDRRAAGARSAHGGWPTAAVSTKNKLNNSHVIIVHQVKTGRLLDRHINRRRLGTAMLIIAVTIGLASAGNAHAAYRP